jgi:CubicO group peptidase (beta-lactamase class C family)
LVLEQVGGKLYAEQMNELVFKPLGMKRTTFYPTLAMTYPHSQGHEADGQDTPMVVRPFPNNAAYWPAGFMLSSVNDLARFAIAFMHGGELEGKSVISPAAIAQLTTPVIDVVDVAENVKYGYGIDLARYRGINVVKHGGHNWGFTSQLWMVPKQAFAIIALGNTYDIDFPKTIDKAMELFLTNLQPKPADELGQSMAMSKEEMSNYVGTYVNRGAPNTDIYVKGGKLILNYDTTEYSISKVNERIISIVPLTNPKKSPLHLVAVKGAGGSVEMLYYKRRFSKKVQYSK